jgi:hypothetical protein
MKNKEFRNYAKWLFCIYYKFYDFVLCIYSCFLSNDIIFSIYVKSYKIKIKYYLIWSKLIRGKTIRKSSALKGKVTRKKR